MTPDTDLATVRSWLRDAYSHDTPHAALDRVEAELSRLRHAESQFRYYREKYEERAEELEIELATLLAEGKVESALLLKGDFTDQERNLIRQAYEAGISHGKSSVQAELARLQREAESLKRWQLAYAKGREGLVKQADHDFERAETAEAELARLTQAHDDLLTRWTEQLNRATAAERELARLQDDDAVMDGVRAVRHMLQMRVGDKHAHAEAFRRALLADTPEDGADHEK